MHNEDLRFKGTVDIIVRGPDGKVKEHKTIRNKVTDKGLAHIVARLLEPDTDTNSVGTRPARMRYMGLGTGTVAAAGSNTALGTEVTGVSGSATGRIDMAPDVGVNAASSVDQVYQGKLVGGTLTADAQTSATEGATAKTGTKLVFTALFNPGNPSTSNVAITEAGIFNADRPGVDQTMLCRTVFQPVNKGENDSLQITWSISLADATI